MLKFNSKNSETCFSEKPFTLNHDLSNHPLLQLDALAAFAARLDRDKVEFNSGKLAANQDPSTVPGIHLEAAEVIRKIETAEAWLVLKNIENDPKYRRLIEENLLSAARAQGHETLAAADMLDPQGFIFVASANSVTPFHADYEQNLFVHLRGDKTMHIYDNQDRSLVSEAELETYPGKHRNLVFDESFNSQGTPYSMQAGDGVFLPYTWPHWVETGDDFAISMAITWKTRCILARNKLLFVNAVLRKMKWPQPFPGRYPKFDGIKIAAYTAARAIIDPLRKTERARNLFRRVFFGRKANYYYDNEPAE